jgi:hypothetical protein
MSNQSDPDPIPVVPPSIEENPSATGLVDADEEELTPAPPPEGDEK